MPSDHLSWAGPQGTLWLLSVHRTEGQMALSPSELHQYREGEGLSKKQAPQNLHQGHWE